MEGRAYAAYPRNMYTPFWKQALPPGMSPEEEAAQELSAEGIRKTSGEAQAEAVGLNLAENFESLLQQQILDALPVLVFLERAGKVVYANAEARSLLGHTEGEWIARPMEEVVWGLSPGTAEPLTKLIGTRKGSPFHATVPARSGQLLSVEGIYSLLNAELRESVIVAHPSGRERAPKSRLMEEHPGSRGDCAWKPCALHQSRVYHDVRVHRRRGKRGKPH